jgi:hypothetical protein
VVRLRASGACSLLCVQELSLVTKLPKRSRADESAAGKDDEIESDPRWGESIVESREEDVVLRIVGHGPCVGAKKRRGHWVPRWWLVVGAAARDRCIGPLAGKLRDVVCDSGGDTFEGGTLW